MHDKKDDYEQAGVKEYVVLAVHQCKVYWFLRREGRFVEMPPDADGITGRRYIPVFGSMAMHWYNSTVAEVLRQGLESAKHAAFVKKLSDVAKKWKRLRSFRFVSEILASRHRTVKVTVEPRSGQVREPTQFSDYALSPQRAAKLVKSFP